MKVALLRWQEPKDEVVGANATKRRNNNPGASRSASREDEGFTDAINYPPCDEFVTFY